MAFIQDGRAVPTDDEHDPKDDKHVPKGHQDARSFEPNTSLLAKHAKSKNDEEHAPGPWKPAVRKAVSGSMSAG